MSTTTTHSNRTRIAWVTIAILALVQAGAGQATPASAAPVGTTVSINTAQVVNQDFLGVGVNLIPVSLMPNNLSKGYDAAYWEQDVKRILTLEPKVARVWFQPDWMEQTKGVYDWQSPKMLAFYKYLDVLKAAGTEVELNYGWKVARAQQSWFSIPGVEGRISAPADLPAFAAGASALLNELITVRGYDNVDYLAFYNEPNGYWDFEAPNEAAYYAQMVRVVHDRLVADGRRSMVKIWGPEEWNSVPWTQHMYSTSNDVLDAYSFHVYGGTYSDLSTEISARKSIIGSKPLVLSEFGFGGNYDSWWGAGYGNYVIKMANEGVKSGLIWQLNGVWVEDPDETTDTNDTYTLWDSSVANSVPNLRFYEAGLLSRYIPEHSDVVSVSTGSADVRATAFRTAGGEYTILVETNENSEGRALTFDFGGVNINRTFNKFVYTDAVVPESNALLPSRTGTFSAGTSFTDTTITGSRNVIIYTTQAPETQVALTPVSATISSGQTTTLSAQVIDGSGGVSWSVVGSGNGSISSGGVYTAPTVTQPTRVAIRATSTSSSSSYGVALVKVLPAASGSQVALPSYSLDGGTYTGSQSLTITSATPGATIRYTLDGSAPSASSTVYTAPVSLAAGLVSNTYVVKALAFKSGVTTSPTASATYRILAGSIGGPSGYTYCATESQMCAFPGTASVAYGANGSFLYGTFDRRVACSSTAFGGDPAPGAQKKCFYLASAGGTVAAAPTFSPAGGSFTSAQSVTLSSSTSGAAIRYTTDGSTPTTSSSLYSGAISVSSTTTIKAIATKSGLSNSGVVAATYTISSGGPGGPAGYTYCADEFGTCSFSGTVNVAFGAGTSFNYGTFTNSVVCTAGNFGGDPAFNQAKKCYYQTQSAVAAPTFSPAGGTFSSTQSVAMSTTTSGASIRYTTDGSTPSASSSLYSGPISVASTTTIKAIALKSGLADSSVVSATYTISPGGSGGPAGYTYCADEFGTCTFSGTASVAFGAGTSYSYATFTGSAVCSSSNFGGDPAYNQAKKCYYQATSAAAAPTFSPAGGTFTSTQSVSLSTSTPGASVRYTIDGSTPTAASTLYSGAISVATTTTVKAIAIKAGLSNSAVASATYTISSGGTGGPAGYTYCADEFGTCTFSGTKSVAFGASGSFYYGTFTGSAVCSAAAFGGDPAYNQAKKCYTQ